MSLATENYLVKTYVWGYWVNCSSMLGETLSECAISACLIILSMELERRTQRK